MIKAYKLIDLSGFFMSVLFIYALAAYPEISINGAKDGLSLALYTVFPSVFPFMVTAKYIMYSGYADKLSNLTDKIFKKAFNIPKGSSVAFLIGIISGYPIGGAVLSHLVNQKALTKDNASVMLGYCNNSSPVFIIGTVGAIILKNVYAGYILYGIHLISAFIVAFISRNKIAPQKHLKGQTVKVTSSFTKAVSDSSISILNISCYIVFFSVVSNLIIEIFKFNHLIPALFSGIIEISNGIKLISGISLTTPLKYAIISALLGFSGLCVMFQTSAVVCKENLSMKEYLKSKLLFAIISYAISLIVFLLIKI